MVDLGPISHSSLVAAAPGVYGVSPCFHRRPRITHRTPRRKPRAWVW